MKNPPSYNLSRWAVTHPSFILFLIGASLLAGLQAYLQMGRAEDPSFTIKTAIVSASWPGATAEEMQRQVAERIEDKLRETPYLDFLRTYCLPERMLVLVQLKDTIPKKQVPDTWYQVRKKLNDIRGSLPQGVFGPSVNDEYGDVYSAIYAFHGEDYTPAELKRVVESARKRLLRIGDVEKIDIIGEQPEKVFIELSHNKLATLGISPQKIFDSVTTQNAIVPAGKIETDRDRVFVRVDGEFDAVQSISNVPISGENRTLKLGDIAEIKRGYEDPSEFTVRFDGKQSVALGVVMRKGGNVLALGESIAEEMKVIQSEVPFGVEVGTIAFQPSVVEESVTEFLRSFIEALIIVLCVSFLSLGFRTGIVVALSVPTVLAISLVIMNAIGMDLDRISLGALILALGLLVDDAIIAVEMMAVKLEQGWSRVDAATFAWSSTAFPMLSGTMITAAGFIPVGFAKSAAGEYAGGIFWVVGIALMTSWFTAVVFTPYLGVLLLPEKKASAKLHHNYDTGMYRMLRSIITLCVRNPSKVIAVTLVAFVASMYGFTKLQQQFFPQSSRPELMVDIKMPQGSSFLATAEMVRRVEALLKDKLPPEDSDNLHTDQKLPILSVLGHAAPNPDWEVNHFTSYTGAGAARFFLALNPDLPNATFAKIVIQTTGVSAREKLRAELLEKFDTDPLFAEPRLRVLRLDFGPPVGFPVQFRVMGPSREGVMEIAERVREIMRQEKATVDVNFEWSEASKVVRFSVDQDRARSMGLNTQEISSTLQTLLSGTPIAQFREGTETIEVIARAVPEERMKLAGLPNLSLFNKDGKAIPISQVAKAHYELEPPILWRRNQETMLTVRSDIIDGVQAPDITNKIFPKLLALDLPPGYRIERGGAVEESEKANQALFSVFPLMILIMLTLLMLQVQSFKKAALVFGIAPLGLIGAVAFLLIFNAPFGFVALLGVIALAGMDMRNSVILIDQIEQDMVSGLTEWEAVIESAVRRARPVILTAATAILAMIPLTRSVFWGPMAIAIMGGLSVATFLTLINLPALYVLFFRVKPPETTLPDRGQAVPSQTSQTNHNMRLKPAEDREPVAV